MSERERLEESFPIGRHIEGKEVGKALSEREGFFFSVFKVFLERGSVSVYALEINSNGKTTREIKENVGFLL